MVFAVVFPFALIRIIYHSRDVSLGIRHHSAFVSLTNTETIRSVTENTVITTTFAIRSYSGELSRLSRLERGSTIWRRRRAKLARFFLSSIPGAPGPQRRTTRGSERPF